jgi:PAS domain S-box-containing protein
MMTDGPSAGLRRKGQAFGESMFATCTLKPANEIERLAALHELDLIGGDGIPELETLTRLAADVCNAELSAITVLDANDAHRIAMSAGERGAVARCDTVCTRLMLTNDTLVVPDAKADPDLKDTRFVCSEINLRSYVGVPVGAEKGLPVGVLCVTHKEPNAFGPREIARLERIADLVRLHLETRLVAIRAARAAAKTDEERRRHVQFELIFEAIHEGVNVYGTDGKVREANQSACDLLGLTRDEMFGRAYADPRWRIFRADETPFPVEEFPVNVTLKTGRPLQDVPMGVELPSGERRWININTVAMRNPQTDAVEYAVVTFKDMTAQRRAEDSLKAEAHKLAVALETAENASQAKTDFLSVMSHELRTPMNAILGCAALVKQDSMSPMQKRTLGVLEDASRQMLALLNDLFDLVSFDADKVRLNPEPTNLVRLIEDAAVIWAAEVRAKGLTLSVMIDPALRAQRAVDPGRMLQIIGNLMANAIKFTSEGHVAIQAWPDRLASGMEAVAIEVEDTGPGVSPEDALRIFSPFEQVDVSSKRRHGGLGIGLYVARRLSQAMGGDVELESREGEGSRFTVRVGAPLAGAANDAGEEAAEAMEAREVLCVDDNPRNLFVLGAILKAAGHNVTECASGAEALEAAKSRKFDVILLDMVMPDMDGLDVLARLKAEGGPNARTPVVACTANVLPDQVKAYRGAGTVAVIAKPIDVTEVLKVVQAMAA